jgi:ATP-dependent HslUV protease ATP-binding subunit HslU
MRDFALDGEAPPQEMSMSTLTPREIVAELDKFIIGQEQAKKMVAVAVRNRWRRQRVAPELRDEVAPKNIIMMGPTGVGKTEIARRLAKLAGAPFVKVEATKFTEVGYVGRDVESMVRDLVEIGVNMVREEENKRVRKAAESAAELRLMDLLLPRGDSDDDTSGANTRAKLTQQFRKGLLNEGDVELDVPEQSGASIDVFAIPGMEHMGEQVRHMFSKAFPTKSKRRKMKIPKAYEALIQEESAKLIDMDAIAELAKQRVQDSGIIFIDEIDKIASTSKDRSSDISREGVQRDLLPIVEGSSVNTKYGMVRTDHILFIAAGAFNFSKPSDMIPELQGRFPLRVELQALGKEEFLRILTEPDNALTKQYAALLATEDVSLTFTPDGLEEIADFAEDTNARSENIGARRLYTIMEKILADISFLAPETPGAEITVNREYVSEHLVDVRLDEELRRYIL